MTFISVYYLESSLKGVLKYRPNSIIFNDLVRVNDFTLAYLHDEHVTENEYTYASPYLPVSFPMSDSYQLATIHLHNIALNGVGQQMTQTSSSPTRLTGLHSLQDRTLSPVFQKPHPPVLTSWRSEAQCPIMHKILYLYEKIESFSSLLGPVSNDVWSFTIAHRFEEKYAAKG